jgi:DNA-binding NtrC family response regulator
MRVMLVEDDADILNVVEKYLIKWSFAVDAFGDPVLAWQHFQDHAASYSVLLSDIRMPVMSGLELAKLIKMLKPDIKIVLMTAYEISQSDFDVPVIKYEDILKKPFKLVEVCNAIKKQLAT